MIYTLHLSNGSKVPVNETELQKFKDNVSSNFIELTAGIINPSFVVSIILDTELSMIENKKKMSLLETKNFTDNEIKFLKENVGDIDPYTVKRIDSIINRNLIVK